MSELARFQDAFEAALHGDGAVLTPWLAGPADGLSVYCNTVHKGLADAIVAAYPAVERLVGTEWLFAAAGLFVREHPPAVASLVLYGEAFPGWLAGFGPAKALPYLPGIAQLDRLWLEAHLAADAPSLAPQAFAALAAGGLGAEDLESTAAVLHPSVRLAWFGDNTPSLWIASRPGAETPEAFEMTETGEGILIARPGLEVQSQILEAGSYAFLAACRDGRSLAAAAEAAAGAQGDLAEILTFCLAEGVFTALGPARPIGGPP